VCGAHQYGDMVCIVSNGDLMNGRVYYYQTVKFCRSSSWHAATILLEPTGFRQLHPFSCLRRLRLLLRRRVESSRVESAPVAWSTRRLYRSLFRADGYLLGNDAEPATLTTVTHRGRLSICRLVVVDAKKWRLNHLSRPGRTTSLKVDGDNSADWCTGVG